MLRQQLGKQFVPAAPAYAVVLVLERDAFESGETEQQYAYVAAASELESFGVERFAA